MFFDSPGDCKMNLRNNFSTSFICIILIFLISFPLQSKSWETKVIIELLNDNSYRGVLFEVTQDEVIIYENEKVRIRSNYEN